MIADLQFLNGDFTMIRQNTGAAAVTWGAVHCEQRPGSTVTGQMEIFADICSAQMQATAGRSLLDGENIGRRIKFSSATRGKRQSREIDRSATEYVFGSPVHYHGIDCDAAG